MLRNTKQFNYLVYAQVRAGLSCLNNNSTILVIISYTNLPTQIRSAIVVEKCALMYKYVYNYYFITYNFQKRL